MEEYFKAKKSLGQHFLTSDTVPGWMADAAKLKEGDIVLEVGPGTGVLTRELLSRGAKVIALETDIRALKLLGKEFDEEIEAGQLILHHMDVRRIDFEHLKVSDGAYKLVANIPYYLSGHLFRTFLESRVQPSTLVFLVQKEVAVRIAREKKESLLSLSVKVYGDPEYVRTVSRGHFNPKPAVDSAILAVRNIGRKRLYNDMAPCFFNILHLGFGSKRKQLMGNLSKRYDRELLVHIFSTCSIPEDARAEDIGLEKWLEVTNALCINNK